MTPCKFLFSFPNRDRWLRLVVKYPTSPFLVPGPLWRPSLSQNRRHERHKTRSRCVLLYSRYLSDTENKVYCCLYILMISLTLLFFTFNLTRWEKIGCVPCFVEFYLRLTWFTVLPLTGNYLRVTETSC